MSSSLQDARERNRCERAHVSCRPEEPSLDPPAAVRACARPCALPPHHRERAALSTGADGHRCPLFRLEAALALPKSPARNTHAGKRGTHIRRQLCRRHAFEALRSARGKQERLTTKNVSAPTRPLHPPHPRPSQPIGNAHGLRPLPVPPRALQPARQARPRTHAAAAQTSRLATGPLRTAATPSPPHTPHTSRVPPSDQPHRRLRRNVTGKAMHHG